MSRLHGMQVVRSLIASSLLVAFAAWGAAATYPTPDAAGDALVAALKAGDQAALAKVLGSDWRTYIPTDGVDRDDVDAFVDDYASAHKFVTEGSTTHLAVGTTNWVLPIPLEKGASGWSFDTRAGRDEIVARQIGHNETSVVQALLAYYDAQRDYASTAHDNDAVPHYAARLVSTPGKHDGLYWPGEANAPESPLGPYFASPPSGDEYYGYHYRILTAQGPSAPGGAYGYMSGKVMANGFALIAWPARYGESGVMSFEISHDGQVFQKDLGKDTARAVTAITRFDPDSSWTEVPVTP
ncbi:MAG: DUF2950 domain-containing protein [Luteibacter sp.]